MNMVVLDGHALNPGDLAWDELMTLGECRVYPRTPREQVLERAAGSEIVLTNKVVLDRDALNALPTLRYVGVLATGFNVVDVAAARECGVVVTNVPDYSTRSVAQFTFALLLELVHHVGHHARAVRDGAWTRSLDFCFWDHPLLELDGLTFGIVGYGRIGREVAKLAQAFGLQVLIHSRSESGPLPPGAAFATLDQLLQRSDIVSLHCPLTPDTQQLINASRLGLMKPGAFLINTSRGPLIDEPALAVALQEGHLAGAALDVLGTEPPASGNPLLRTRNCLITPHIAWATRAARQRLIRIAVANVRAFLGGQPQNVVS